MANIEKRGQYQWRALVRRKGYKPVSRTFPTKGEALDWARDVEAQIHLTRDALPAYRAHTATRTHPQTPAPECKSSGPSLG